MAEIITSRFGRIEIEPEDILHFPEGLVGLSDCRQWTLLTDDRNEAVVWLQSVDRVEIALAAVSPRRFVPGYRMRVARRELEPLGLTDVGSAQVLAIVGNSDEAITLNLKAPLVINPERQLGRQVVTNGQLPLRHEIVRLDGGLRKSA